MELDKQKEIVKSRDETIRSLKANILEHLEQLRIKDEEIKTLEDIKSLRESLDNEKLHEMAQAGFKDASVANLKKVLQVYKAGQKKPQEAATQIRETRSRTNGSQAEAAKLQQPDLQTKKIINDLKAKIEHLKGEKEELKAKLESAEDDLLRQVSITKGIAERGRNSTGKFKRTREASSDTPAGSESSPTPGPKRQRQYPVRIVEEDAAEPFSSVAASS